MFTSTFYEFVVYSLHIFCIFRIYYAYSMRMFIIYVVCSLTFIFSILSLLDFHCMYFMTNIGSPAHFMSLLYVH